MTRTAMHLLIAGFQHETNTFAPSRADWAAFCSGESFPGYVHGEAMLAALAPQNLPAAGMIAEARARGWTLVPSCWAGATPSAQITDDAFERLAARIVEDVRLARAAGTLDAIYLDLHGAAVTDSHDDAEGELLRRVRAAAGPDLPIVASLDLHANLGDAMFAAADALVAYRTYPHVDGADTGRRAAALLARRLAHGRREAAFALRLPFLLPLNVQCTEVEPAASIYRELAALEAAHDVVLSFAPGFPAADIADCGPVVWGHGPDAEHAVRRLHDRIDRPREQWRPELLAPREAVRLALATAGDRPVVIADTQDNPGAGGDSNTTGMLHALVAEEAGRRCPGRVALGLLWDPEAVAAAAAAGEGATLRLSLGREVPVPGLGRSDPPFVGDFVVRRVSTAPIVLTGPMSLGRSVDLGVCVALEHQGIGVAVSERRCQMLDRALFRAVGIEPEAMRVVVVKSSVHFRADFAPIAERILVATAPGPMPADPALLPWRKLPATTALRP